MECSKRDTCQNRDAKCAECHALANVYDHHPWYSNLVNHVDFMEKLEEIALQFDLRLIMQRAPVGCGFIFMFKNDRTHQFSPTCITWDYHRQNVDWLIHHLHVLARDFSKEE